MNDRVEKDETRTASINKPTSIFSFVVYPDGPGN